MRIRKPTQLQFKIAAHGEKRRGAGRKKQRQGQPNHEKRPQITGRHPLGITLKMQPGINKLRSLEYLRALAKAAQAAKRFGVKVIHFSIQTNHIHMIVEAESNEALGRGMRALNVTLSKIINKLMRRKGKALLGRYHLHLLKTPREVKNALSYVLFNLSKHMGLKDKVLDSFSSVHSSELKSRAQNRAPPPWQEEINETSEETATWLLKQGWKRA